MKFLKSRGLISLIYIILTGTASAKALTWNADSPDVIDNKKLVELTKSGLGSDIIIGFINSSPTNFDCGMNSIIALKKDSVTEKVLVEVMKHCSDKQNSVAKAVNTNNPMEKHEGGIFCYQYKDTTSEYELKKLYTTVVSGQSSGGFGAAMAQSYTYGLAKTSVKSEISGASANVKLLSSGIFYFYFDAPSQTNTPGAWWFHTATSPNEFSLIKLKVKKDVREYKSGTSNAYTDKTGIDQDQKIAFTFEEVSPGIFKVIPSKHLPPGEYCFIYSAAVPTMYTNDKVFDFSILK
jgi:hypothetical protein